MTYVKKPRHVLVGIVGDDDAQTAHDQATTALADIEARLNRDQARRAGVCRAAGMEPVEALTHVAAEDEKTLAPYRQAVQDAEAGLDRVTLWFRFQSIGRTAYQALLAAHPATEEDHTALRARFPEEKGIEAAYHRDTFVPALIAAACADPILTVEVVNGWFASPTWSEAELGVLFGAALDVNTRARVNQP